MGRYNPKSGIGLILVFAFFWLVTWGAAKILSVSTGFLPDSWSDEQKGEFVQAGFVSLFLGGFSLIGLVLSHENVLSTWLLENGVQGMRLNFIDPLFALIALLCIWAYAIYRITR